jgi:hypothetical protein
LTNIEQEARVGESMLTVGDEDVGGIIFDKPKMVSAMKFKKKYI